MLDTKIALVQMESKLGGVKENLEKINGYVNQAAGEKADIICFPEMCITGYGRDIAKKIAVNLEAGDVSRPLMEMSAQNNIVIVVGLAECNDDGKPFITQLVVQPKGVVEKYRKTHLGNSEKPYYSPGSDFKVFDHTKVKFGIQICWDMHFPEMTAILS
ncbi:hypothetical protein N752_26745 [Desulforamulus aquiferis]|nr:nitrilase-related carbon-nitrogen hydrolase [Desulforamulus aquiferis]RYD02053.1 hypothetical protein N752_26745 [Desulforamulus aquiferis]